MGKLRKTLNLRGLSLMTWMKKLVRKDNSMITKWGNKHYKLVGGKWVRHFIRR